MALQHVTYFGITIEYVLLLLGVVWLIPLNVSAFIALDWNRGMLIPVLIAVAPISIILLSYPTVTTDIAFLVPVLAITGILQMVIPMGLYFYLWRRMSAATRGLSRVVPGRRELCPRDSGDWQDRGCGFADAPGSDAPYERGTQCEQVARACSPGRQASGDLPTARRLSAW